MKIGFVSSVGAEENSPIASLNKRVDQLARQQMDLVKGKETEIIFQMPRSSTGMVPEKYSYLKHLEDAETLHGYMELAKTEDCDAIIGWCFLDPMKKEARQALDIPVIGIAETAMHMSCLMGAKFGVITPDIEAEAVTDEYIRTLGLQDRAVPSRAIPLENPWASLTDATEGIEAMIKVSRELIADGAEVIIPGCVLVDVMAANVPGCEKKYPSGLREIDGVPVLDVAGYAIKQAETLVAMKNANIPWISRKNIYVSAKDDEAVMEQAASILEYRGPGFWLD